MSDVRTRIEDLIKSHKVMLFMKGTRQFPRAASRTPSSRS